ncbi:MAG: hypothetical protein M3505_00545 [Verrucomicrobiota bacterium]|nr:hypothetical protein [Verrucomicrobiota bacterium]
MDLIYRLLRLLELPREDSLPPFAPAAEDDDFAPLKFPVRDDEEPPEDRLLDFDPREPLLFPPLRDAPLLDPPLFAPAREPPRLDLPRPERLLELLDFFEPEALTPKRWLLRPPEDFFAPEDLPLRDDDDFPPPDGFFALDDFELLPRFADEDRLVLDDLLPELLPLLEDLPEPKPVARFAAPAAWVTARFALSTFSGLVDAFPASAPMTPPTTAPTGPATLPTTAPAAAPASVFEIVGMFSVPEEEDDGLSDC